MVYLSHYLKLSESLAGVTLIAFANGSGDVITAIVASESPEGLSYNIGSLFGAGLFVVTLIVSLTITVSPVPIKLDPGMIQRDIGFYIMASLLVLIYGVMGEIGLWESIGMLLLYLIYVIMVIC